MNIFKLFRHERDDVQYKLDEIIMDGLMRDEMLARRQSIMKQFDDLLEVMQEQTDEIGKIREELKENNELLKMMCKGGA